MNSPFKILCKRFVIIVAWVGLIFSSLFWLAPLELSTEKKTLHIFSWSDTLSLDILKKFEQETGIKIHIDYYASNEEMIVKLKNLKTQSYDLIIPSDYAISMLREQDLLKPLNKSKLNFIKDINPILLGHEYDANNTYSLPLEWDIYGFGIDQDFFKDADNMTFSWDHLFNDEVINYKIAMTNDPIDAFGLAACYLFGKKDTLTPKEALLVKRLLIDQKKHVAAYAVPRADYVLGSKNASLALSLSAYVLRSKQDFPFMKFVVPKDKTFISIENVAIPKGSVNEDNVYTLLNFLYQPENLSTTCNFFELFPATLTATELCDTKEDALEISKQIQKPGYELFFSKHLMPEKNLRTLWIEIKS